MHALKEVSLHHCSLPLYFLGRASKRSLVITQAMEIFLQEIFLNSQTQYYFFFSPPHVWISASTVQVPTPLYFSWFFLLFSSSCMNGHEMFLVFFQPFFSHQSCFSIGKSKVHACATENAWTFWKLWVLGRCIYGWQDQNSSHLPGTSFTLLYVVRHLPPCWFRPHE